MALLHDADELPSGDVRHGAKYDYGPLSEKLRDALKELGTFAFECALRSLRDPRLHDEYTRLVREESALATPESLIVKIADALDVILFYRREKELGNESVQEDLAKAATRATELERKLVDLWSEKRRELEADGEKHLAALGMSKKEFERYLAGPRLVGNLKLWRMPFEEAIKVVKTQMDRQSGRSTTKTA